MRKAEIHRARHALRGVGKVEIFGSLLVYGKIQVMIVVQIRITFNVYSSNTAVIEL